MNILGVSGSLRAESFNTRLLKAAQSLLADDVTMAVFPLGDIPLYNQDVETRGMPSTVTEFRGMIERADALLIATPEYNYSVPGVLKNAIDWASRPPFKSPLVAKPTAIVSASVSGTGGVRSQAHLKQILSGTLSLVYPSPEYLLGTAMHAFDENGKLTGEEPLRRLQRFMDNFVNWCRALSRPE